MQCPGSNVQLNAVATTASPYCTATGGTGTYYITIFPQIGGTYYNTGSGLSARHGTFYSQNVTQAVGSSINWSASNFLSELMEGHFY
jgi:hypothetical protein